MTRDPFRQARELTRGQAHAMRSAFEFRIHNGALDGLYLRPSTRRDLRQRLADRGLVSRRDHQRLTKLGLSVRAILTGEA